MPQISIIICTFNRDKYIYALLQSIAENEFPTEKYEIVLVDNNCTDNTKEECQRFQETYPHIAINYCVENNQGLSYARNKGISEAKAEIIVFVDDDAKVNSQYLQSYFNFFQENIHSYAAGGAILPIYETSEPNWMSYYTRQLVTGMLYLGEKQKPFSKGKFPGGGNAAYRKIVFDKIGLFNVELGRKGNSLIGAEEKDIFDKMTSLGMKFYYLPTAILYHIIPATKLTTEYFYRLTYSIGVSEKYRTLSISKLKYVKRLVLESVKWAASLLLWIYYALQFQIRKGNRLIVFRFQVTKGLFKGNLHV